MKNRMIVGVVIHGPEIIDSGGAGRVLDVLSEHYEVTAFLGGTMGRTAVIDAHLEDRIDISRRMSLSGAINSLPWVDAVVLLNRGKTTDSGIAFGRIVMSRTKPVPIIQIERPMEADGVVIPWNDAESWAEQIAGMLGLPVMMPPPAQDVSVVCTDGDQTRRRIHDTLPGETIRINGIVVGTVVSDGVEIVTEDGRIVDIAGARMKEHGIEKLGRIDPGTALVRTGSIRRTDHVPRIGTAERRRTNLSVVLIDHDAESTFELAADADLAVTIGDDTTAIAGDILYRLGIPIIGITDMDIDYVLTNADIFPGSVVLRVDLGYDDIVGGMVRNIVFDGGDRLKASSIDSLREQVIAIAGERLIEVVSY
ncbi:MAG TPA: DUF2117 domain-containing protein [Methanosarcinales archaeon]|nr:DUF2117 domain-containing protein [Methanosarcinales archaeon]